MNKADQLVQIKHQADADNYVKGQTDGFLVYEKDHLPKINSIRRLISAPDAKEPPILTEGQAGFSAASESGNLPRSCYSCPFYNYNRTCQLHSAETKVKKLLWPGQEIPDSKQIEYWPVCDYWAPGEPNYGKERFLTSLNPDHSGLCWINAPEVGQEHGGSCCGGREGGDDCDLWMTAGDDKRMERTGFCRVLQRNTNNMDCCNSWIDDDLIDWKTAQERFSNG